MSNHTVTSEVLTERNNFSKELENGSTISKFFFNCPSYMLKPKFNSKNILFDEDDDLDMDRDRVETLFIEHSSSTELQLVGLQLWRGAFLLADYILSNPNLFRHQIILELGSGVGLTSIVASFLAKYVICTDINLGDLLKLIKRNFIRNKSYVKCKYDVKELNFLNLKWPKKLEKKLDAATIIIAADVIYDDEITNGFVSTLAKLLSTKTPKTVYIALEKRYVFTINDMETTAPMYEEFLRCIERRKLDWDIEHIKIDFPRYFIYDRVKQMTLIKIQNKNISNEISADETSF